MKCKIKTDQTGKLDAGNPHVRFDEGEVAPAAKPRRGSLLYISRQMALFSCMVMSVAWASVPEISGAPSFAFRDPEVVPVPKRLEYDANTAVHLNATTSLFVACADATAGEWVKGKMKSWFGFEPRISMSAVASGNAKLQDWQRAESYSITASPGQIVVEAHSLLGVKYAMQTIRQMAEREGETSVTGYRLPKCSVSDWPALRFRGLHVCWFPEMSANLVERMVRQAAYYKMNHVVVENWGAIRSDRYPFLSVPGAKVTLDDIHRLVDIARDLGIELVPQVNVFGHAALARQKGGKHVVLDFHPELQQHFEPDGWNWCLSNPETRKLLSDYTAEMHEAFGNPAFVHLGCDEADPPTCARCRASESYGRLLGDHICGIAAMLRQRGARTMIWHDMMLERGDPRWETPPGATEFIRAFGSKDSAAILDMLPEDVVICDWFYGNGLTHFPTLDYFKSRGFDTVTCPWKDKKGIAELTAHARDVNLFGVLETVWSSFRGRGFAEAVMSAACGAWGSETLPSSVLRRRGYPAGTHWRQVGWDAGVATFEESGLCGRQVSRDMAAE